MPNGVEHISLPLKMSFWRVCRAVASCVSFSGRRMFASQAPNVVFLNGFRLGVVNSNVNGDKLAKLCQYDRQ